MKTSVKAFYLQALLATLFACVTPPPASLAVSPRVVAHRAGTGDAPENTLYAIRSALNHGADIIWLSVQVTSDGVPVLYRPSNLSELTNGQGPIGQTTLAAIRQLNAGYHFKQTLSNGKVTYPFRDCPLAIPTLREALQVIPDQTQILLDMKSLPAQSLVRAVAQVLEDTHSWRRARMYSTEAAHGQAWKSYPKAQLFEDRDVTRQRLVDLMLGNPCPPPPPGTWIGIELTRPVDVVEYFTLGKGISKSVAHWWTRDIVTFHKKRGNIHIVLFGIDSKEAYQQAKEMGVDAVMTNSPVSLCQWRCQISKTMVHRLVNDKSCSAVNWQKERD